MSKVIRIGTRESQLAMWQALNVEEQLNQKGYQTKIVPIKSTGDIILDKPLYELGITGVFTKNLDIAMLNNDIDIAVHSMKDVPTALPIGIVQKAVLERHNPKDILVYNNTEFLEGQGTIATSSLRRKAQWLNKYPKHSISDLRGNVNTRLKKVEENNWGGAIFAKAGLERINVLPNNNIELDWMIPAPAQGAIMVVCNENDKYSCDAVSKLNHSESEICCKIERDFLRTLEGGCTAPIGGYAQIKNNKILFEGIILTEDGKEKVEIYTTLEAENIESLGKELALQAISKGADRILKKLTPQ